MATGAPGTDRQRGDLSQRKDPVWMCRVGAGGAGGQDPVGEPVGAPGWGCRQAGSCRVGVSGDTRDGLEGGRLRITFLPVADDLHQAG